MTETVTARVIAVGDGPVHEIKLQVPASYAFDAGQYLSVVHSDGTHIPLSIASDPGRLPELELHFRPLEGDPLAVRMSALMGHDELQITPAGGSAICPADAASLLLLAGGVGASHAFSCARHRSRVAAAGETRLLWCGDTPDSVYRVDELHRLLEGRVEVVIDADRSSANQGLVWLRNHVAETRYDRMLLSGSPSFVYACTDVLHAAGVDPETLRSDVYDYAPRNSSP